MMEITNLHHFLKTYFTAQHCQVIEDQEDLLTVQLTEELDRELMNRPFYWHYIKSIGQTGESMKLSFNTNPNRQVEGSENIHFGSPRLQKIITHLKASNKFIKLFQVIETGVHTPLYPWLLINIKINYQGKHKKSELFSIGLQLINGLMKTEMMDLLSNESLNKVISDFCYPISPLITMKSGYRRIETVLENYIDNQSHDWAKDSIQALNEELKLLDHFYYEETEESATQIEKERETITNRYTPTITFEVINGGIIYLMEDFHTD